MTCAEFKDLVGSYALGALDDDERASCETHLATPHHEGCRDALAVAQATVSSIPLALPPMRPPPSIWDRIERELAPAPRRRRSVWPVIVPSVLCVAAVVALLVGWRDQGEQARVAAAERDRLHADVTRVQALQRDCTTELAVQRDALLLLAEPSARLVPLAPQGNGRDQAVVIFDAQRGKAAIVARGLAAQPGKDYELWVIKGDAKKPAGLLRSDSTGGLTAMIDPATLAEGVDAFAVSLEPTGGSPAPTGPILLVGKA